MLRWLETAGTLPEGKARRKAAGLARGIRYFCAFGCFFWAQIGQRVWVPTFTARC